MAIQDKKLKQDLDQLLKVRLARKDDEALIYQTWLKGLYFGSSWFSKMDQKVFFQKYRVVINSLLPRSQVFIAALKEEEDTVLGYSVTQNNLLHWIFVKTSWRKMGLAKRLIPDNINTVTHLTDLVRPLLPKKFKFDPFMIGE